MPPSPTRPSSRVVVVSTRLPARLERSNGGFGAEPAPGGLATALRAVRASRDFLWVGWPGVAVSDEAQPEAERVLTESAPGCVPVFLDEDDVEGFYREFSNRVLWPLFHALPERQSYSEDAWRRYRRVNEAFADRVAALVEPGDAIWVHDYQLTLLPELLRRRCPDCPIGFFLHIPFPGSETYRTLPAREAVLRGMLGAHFIGFHAYEYVAHFRSACLRVLGLDSDPETVWVAGHPVRLGVLPIGIDPQEMADMARTDSAEAGLARLRDSFGDRKVVVGVDRLDYTKGLPHKLRAFEVLLEEHPELRDKVVLVQVAAPSRTGVEDYQQLKREVDELVGRINGEAGGVTETPIVYINQSVDRGELAALYRHADVALVTPVRDGMNLVALEYVAAREEPGTLLLSEFTGAASCLPGARLINPYDTARVAEELHRALTSEPSAEAWEQMREFAWRNTSMRWAEQFLARLEDTWEELRGGVQVLDFDTPALAGPAREAERPLMLLDYDGTLVPHVAIPAEAKPDPALLDVLERLSERATVIVISGRPAHVLDEWLGHLKLGMVCEHGLASKPVGGEWSEPVKFDRSLLDDAIVPLLQDFVGRTPGSKIEHKAGSVAWHYRTTDPKLGAFRANQLRRTLEEVIRAEPYNVLMGSRVVEIRHVAMSKGRAAARLLERHPDADWVFAAGNDRTDEEMFEALHASDAHATVLTCRVASQSTSAVTTLPDTGALRGELAKLLALWSR